MPRKPWIIVLLSLIYIVSPLFIILSNSWVNLIPLWGPSGILKRLAPSDWFILSLYIINGIAIFTVKKPAWWVFLGSSLLLVGYNVIGFLRNPLQPLPAMLLYNILLFAAAALFFRREIIAPYFNPRLRWWESDPRYSLDFYCTIDINPELEAPIRDISQGGCFISTLKELPANSELPITLHLQKLSIQLTAKAVRYSQKPFPGWGIKFSAITEEHQLGLDRLLKKLEDMSAVDGKGNDRREYPRLSLPQWIRWKEEKGEFSARLINLSRTGCCLQTEQNHFEKKGEYALLFPDKQDHFPVRACPVWQDTHLDYSRSGLVFIDETREEKKRIRHLIKFYKAAGADGRNKERDVNNQLLRESLKKTPFPGLYKAE